MDGDVSTRTGPLLGVRVLELGNFIAGPFAGQLFGDYGAEVIKIEAPDGDPMRRWGVCVDDSSLWWPIIARNKRSVVADLKDPDDLAFVQRLAGECDVVLENFRPGVLAKFGLDYDTLSVDEPRRDRHPRVGVRTERAAGDRGRLRVDRRGGRWDPPHHRRPRSPAGAMRHQPRRLTRRDVRRDRHAGRAPRTLDAAAGARRSTWRSTRQWRR